MGCIESTDTKPPAGGAQQNQQQQPPLAQNQNLNNNNGGGATATPVDDDKPFASDVPSNLFDASGRQDEDDLVEQPNMPGMFFGKRNSLSASFTAHSLLQNTDSFALMSFGHPLLDIISVRDHAFLDKYHIENGSSNLVKPEQLPIFKDLASSPMSPDGAAASVQYVAGGAAMNTARIVRWLLRGSSRAKSTCGTRTAMVGATGTDEFEGHLLSVLRTETVEHCFFQKSDVPTGTCAVLVVDGERSLLANLGAATKLTRDDIVDAPSIMAAFGSTKAVYMEGFFMNLVDRDTCVYVAEMCTRFNKLFAFNLSAPYLSAIFPESLKKLLPHVDIIMGSRIDAVAYGKSVGWECADEDKAGSGVDVLPAVVAMLCKMPRADGSSKVFTTDKLVMQDKERKDEQDHDHDSDSDSGGDKKYKTNSLAVPQKTNNRRRKSSTHSITGHETAPRRIVVITDGANATLVGTSNLDDPVRGAPTVTTYQPDRIPPNAIVDSNGAGDAFSGGFLSGVLLRKSLPECVELGHKSANVILRHSGCTFPVMPPFDY